MKVGRFTLIRFHEEWQGGERYWIHDEHGDVKGEVSNVRGTWYAENVFHQVERGYSSPLPAISALITRS